MKLKVAVSGSRRGLSEDVLKMCEEVGEILAKSDVYMINGGSYGVDRHCLIGFKRFSDDYIIYWPTEAKRTPKGYLRMVRGGFLERSKKMAEKCDVLIIVASENFRSGTGATYRAAVANDKIIITITGPHTSPYYEDHADYLIDDVSDLYDVIASLKIDRESFLY